jgi:hypothetical protein
LTFFFLSSSSSSSCLSAKYCFQAGSFGVSSAFSGSGGEGGGGSASGCGDSLEASFGVALLKTSKSSSFLFRRRSAASNLSS